MTESERIQDQLPLTEAVFFILLSLAEGKKHGYAILKDVEALSRGRVVFSSGTLYGALGRLLEQGWIEHVQEDRKENLRPRKAYVLSAMGDKILAAETRRLEALARAARVRLSSGRP
jgi:DNA-binding PadR family transcriptional regulator